MIKHNGKAVTDIKVIQNKAQVDVNKAVWNGVTVWQRGPAEILVGVQTAQSKVWASRNGLTWVSMDMLSTGGGIQFASVSGACYFNGRVYVLGLSRGGLVTITSTDPDLLEQPTQFLTIGIASEAGALIPIGSKLMATYINAEQGGDGLQKVVIFDPADLGSKSTTTPFKSTEDLSKTIMYRGVQSGSYAMLAAKTYNTYYARYEKCIIILKSDGTVAAGLTIGGDINYRTDTAALLDASVSDPTRIGDKMIFTHAPNYFDGSGQTVRTIIHEFDPTKVPGTNMPFIEHTCITSGITCPCGSRLCLHDGKYKCTTTGRTFGVEGLVYTYAEGSDLSTIQQVDTSTTPSTTYRRTDVSIGNVIIAKGATCMEYSTNCVSWTALTTVPVIDRLEKFSL